MRITKVDEYEIMFDNGNTIWYRHCSDCCEWNFADFSILDERTVNYDYDFDENLTFNMIDGEGFTFGNEGHLIFIPCYSYQNGYYSSDINIFYNDKEVLHGDCEGLSDYYDSDKIDKIQERWAKINE